METGGVKRRGEVETGSMKMVISRNRSEYFWVLIWGWMPLIALRPWWHQGCYSNTRQQSSSTIARNPAVPPAFPDRLSPPALKTRLCTKFNTAEGCKFREKCHYAHGEWELGRPARSSHGELHAMGQMPGIYSSGHFEQNEPDLFGASATAKISIDASLVGAVIGRGGMNSKQICRVTGAKLAIRDHESDPNSKNIELEGSFDQIKHASQMVRELIVNVSSGLGRPTKNRERLVLLLLATLKQNFVTNLPRGPALLVKSATLLMEKKNCADPCYNLSEFNLMILPCLLDFTCWVALDY